MFSGLDFRVFEKIQLKSMTVILSEFKLTGFLLDFCKIGHKTKIETRLVGSSCRLTCWTEVDENTLRISVYTKKKRGYE
jgi:trehalose utilization protein